MGVEPKSKILPKSKLPKNLPAPAAFCAAISASKAADCCAAAVAPDAIWAASPARKFWFSRASVSAALSNENAESVF